MASPGSTDPGSVQTSLPKGTIEMLADLAGDGGEETVTIGELIDHMSDRGFGLVLLVLALPVCIPFLYGIPQAVAVPMIFIAAQMAAGRHTLWVPQKARARTVTRDALKNLSLRSAKYVGWFERIARPSLTWATRGIAERIFGALMVVFCASILVPLPLTNTTPGISIAIMSIGFLERDGRLVFLGACIGAFWVSLLLYFGITLGVEGLDLLKSYL